MIKMGDLVVHVKGSGQYLVTWVYENKEELDVVNLKTGASIKQTTTSWFKKMPYGMTVLLVNKRTPGTRVRKAGGALGIVAASGESVFMLEGENAFTLMPASSEDVEEE